MNRTQKLKLNTSASFVNQIVKIISGLILPRLILLYFGSKTNGLVASINQFLSIITFLDLGVGAVIQSALYRPIARKDNQQVSSVLVAARNYFRRIAYILIIYVGFLVLFYPLIVDKTHGYISTGFLILALSISQFGQYYFGIINELLLNANQQSYIQNASEIVVIILNLIISIFLITQGASIQAVKLGAGLIFLIRPFFLRYYVKKNFDIDYKIEFSENPLPQKWSGIGQHIAYSTQNSTAIVTLTLFSTLENISIYSIYNMVVTSIRTLVSSFTNGIGSFFGNLLANDEIDLLNSYFDRIEWIIHTGVIFLYGMTAVLINSFVMIYTSGIEDINYSAPMFSFLLVLAQATYSLRIPYNTVVLSAGHFKQTEVSSYVETALNVTISIILVDQFGVIGVAFGTLVSMLYRTLYLVVYISKNIIFRPLKKFVKHIFVDFISMGIILGVGITIMKMYQIESLADWALVAVILGSVSLFLLTLVNLVFYKSVMNSLVRSVIRKNK